MADNSKPPKTFVFRDPLIDPLQVAAVLIRLLEQRIEREQAKWLTLKPDVLAQSEARVAEWRRKIEGIEQEHLPIVGGKPMDYDEVEMDYALEGLANARKKREATAEKEKIVLVGGKLYDPDEAEMDAALRGADKGLAELKKREREKAKAAKQAENKK